MKRLIIILLLWLGIPFALEAQDALPRTVKEIRQRYADTQQSIAMMNEEEHMKNLLVTTVQHNMPGTGIRKETISCYFGEFGEESEEWAPDYRPFFVTRRFNVSARKFYEEYLFDGESGRLLFVFFQGDSMEGQGKKDETRYYYGPDGLISENVKGERIVESNTALEMAATLSASLRSQLNAFGTTANAY